MEEKEEAIGLRELNRRIVDAVNAAFQEPLWVVAEISECRTAGNGHCYMNLVEKSPQGDGSVLAQMRAVCWANRWWMVKQQFETETGQAIDTGIKVRFQAQVQMHEQYGLSLIIFDIDPTYTLGEMARRRLEIIRQLESEGLIDMQQTLSFPVLPQRVAIISAPNAAGYGDFLHQLHDNPYGICFYTHLFPAILQGSQTESSVIGALNHIALNEDFFDVVVIIRGGGAAADLAAFDSYQLALNAANFPLPIITGIGHDRDKSILDLVAYHALKTPTAVAAFLIDTMGQQMEQLLSLQELVKTIGPQRVQQDKLQLAQFMSTIHISHTRLRDQIAHLNLLKERISMSVQQRLDHERQQHELFERTVQLLQPDQILRRGFSITRIGGRAVKSAADVPAGTLVETQTADGNFSSIVQ